MISTQRRREGETGRKEKMGLNLWALPVSCDSPDLSVSALREFISVSE
jgi:hypothetical protein